MRASLLVLTLVPLLGLTAACGDDGGEGTTTAAGPEPAGLPQGSEPVELDPAGFVAEIDNPYWPMSPGSRWVYRETDAEGTVQRVEVTVTDRTKTILGIEATVVHDVVTEDGEPVEDTYDWYAQDTAGNIWYLGEATKEYENGKLKSTEGSGEAGDEGEILSLDERAEVPFGSFDNLLMTRDTTPLEPDVLEHKFYAEGVGPILALGLSGGVGREELLSYEQGP